MESKLSYLNPRAMGIHPGGEYSPVILIAGQLGLSPDPSEVEGLFLRLLCGAFSRVKSYHVGPRALRALREGARLTRNYAAATELRPTALTSDDAASSARKAVEADGRASS